MFSFTKNHYSMNGTNYLLQLVLGAFMRSSMMFNTDDGGSGTGDDAGSGGDGDALLPFDSKEEELLFKAESDALDNKPGGSDDTAGEGDDSGDSGDAPPPAVTPKAPEQGDDDDDDIDFQDNVLDGISGKDLKNLPKDIQIAAVKAREAIAEANAKAEKQAAILEKLKANPLAKYYLDQAEQGDSAQSSSIPGLSDADANEVQALIDDGKTAEARAKINSFAKAAAEAYVRNTESAMTRKAQFNKELSDAGQVLIDTMRLYKDLDIGETDPVKLALIDESHPKYKQYDEGIGKVVKHVINLQDTGVIRDARKFVLSLGKDGMAALVATVLKKPLVLNADTQINQQIIESNRKLLRKYSRNADEAGSVAPKGGSNINRDKARDRSQSDGVDTKRLVTDPVYHDEMLGQMMGSEGSAGVQKIERLYSEGEKALAEEGEK
jgi:hypothetical protein